MGGDSPDDGDDHLPVVTEIELECIRVAGTGASSKVIARKLGLSYNTVNVYASRVRRILGAEDRFQAAEMLRRYDAGEDLKKFKLNSGPLETPAKSRNSNDVSPAMVEAENRSTLREDRAKFDLAIPLRSSDQPGAVGGWGRDNELTPKQRLWWIMRMAVWIVLATFLAFAAVQSLHTTLANLGFTN